MASSGARPSNASRPVLAGLLSFVIPGAGQFYLGKRWRGAGVSHLCFNTMNAGLSSPQEHIDMIGRFKAAIG